MDIFDLFAKLSLDSEDYEKGLSEQEKKTSSFGQKLGNGLKTAGKIGAAALGAVTTASTVMTKKILDGAAATAEYGDTIDKASQKMGISAEAYQEWDAVLQHSGTDIKVVGRAMATLTKQSTKNADAFKKLGISEKQLAKMSQEEMFEKVIEGLQGMEEGTERTVLAQQLLGGSAKQLGPLLNTSAEDTKKMKQRVHELGGVMSNEAVKAAAAYQDSLQDMTTALDGAKRNITGEFMPAITSVMDGLTEVFSGNGQGGLSKISEGISQFVDKLSQSMPRIMEFGSKVLLSLSDAIIQNLPTLIDAATKTIMTLANGLVEQLPTIVEVGLQMLISLATGIAENLPTLIPTIVDVILKIVDILTDPNNLSLLVDASIAIIIALANGLIDALPRLIEKAPEIVSNLVKAIIKNAPKLFEAAKEILKKIGEGFQRAWTILLREGPKIVSKIGEGIRSAFSQIAQWAKQIFQKLSEAFSRLWESVKSIGRNIIEGIWEGIKSMASWLWNKVSGFFSDLVGGIADFLGIASPSKVFAKMGKFSAEGFGVGFDKEFKDVAKDVEAQMGALTGQSVNVSGGMGSPSVLGTLNDVRGLLAEIRDKDQTIVLNDGTLVGRMDRLLGQTAMRKIRGNA